MTTGSAIKEIVLFAIPLLIGNVFQQFYSMVDTMVAGYNLGDAAIAAIGATQAIDTLIINLANGLNVGFSIILAMAIGAHHQDNVRKSIAAIIKYNIILAIVETALTVIFLRPILRLLKTPDSILDLSYSYILIICAGITITNSYNMFSNILRAFGNSFMTLIYLIISSCINIVLDVLFVAVFKWGVQGAAFATIISAAISSVLSGVYLFKNYKKDLPQKEDWKTERTMANQILTSGVSMSIMYTTVNIGTIIFQSAINSLGAMYITAHTASRKFILMMMQPQTSLASALSTFTSQNWGAKRTDRIRYALPRLTGLIFIWDAIAMMLVYGFGSYIVRFMTGTTDADVIRNAVLSLRINISFFPVLAVFSPIRQVLQAIEQKNGPMVASITELIMKIAITIAIVPKLGFLAVCFAEPIIWIVITIYILFVYAKCRKRYLMA